MPNLGNISIEKGIGDMWLIWDEGNEIYYKLIKKGNSFKVCKQDNRLKDFKEFIESNLGELSKIDVKKYIKLLKKYIKLLLIHTIFGGESKFYHIKWKLNISNK